ncbi:MAG TPA: condensation domain-containing protein, partial [Longimicrobium sp.]
VSTRRVLEAGPPRHLVNGYGPTESACFATTWEVSEVAPGAVSIPIGHPIANTTAYVLEPSMRPAAVGVRGELFLGGDGLARGYLARPGLTAERFVPDPFGDGTRLYRTGDAVRWREDGTLEYMGRLDEQVKIRGFRVEPGEVEAALLALPGVGAAVVVAREDVPGDRRLVGYVTPRGDAHLDSAVLRDALGRGLPEYMVPAALVVLDALPLTPNGKIDRRALPAPEWEGDSYVAPRTETEEVLTRVFGEVLRVEQVGIDDDFFVLGGHSLLAAQAASRLGRAFGVDLPLRTLFEASTARSLGERVDELLAAAKPREAEVELVAIPRDGELPLSFAQERMWFLDRLEPGAGAYNMPIPFTLHGALDVEALRRALEDVVHRHEALRSRFEERDGRPVQTVAPPEPFALPLVETDREEARRAVLAEMWRPFDLAAGPLVRASVFRVAPDEHVVLINLHHITADGWSLGLVFNDLSARYAAHAAGEAGAPEPLALQYADFAAWQRRWLAGDRLQREVDFWRDALDGAPALLALPTDRPRPPAQSYRGAVEGFVIPAATADQVRALAQKEGATLFMVFLAVFQALLGRLAGEDDIVVGTPLAGREHEATESIVGLFVNTLALRGDLAGDPDFLTLLRRVREGSLNAFAHPSLPFERLVDELKTERSLGHAPVFQVMFALQNTPSGTLDLAGARVGGFEGGHGIAKFDLTLNLEESEGGVQGWLEYATDLFDASTARRINEYFARMVAEIAADPRRRLSAIPLADEAERSTVLEWGTGATRS